MTPTALAAAVRARYERRAALVSPAILSLAEHAAPVTLQIVQRHDHFLGWAPRLRFEIAPGRARAGSVACGRSAAPGAVRREQVERIVRRIMAGAERAEVSSPQHDPTPLIDGALPADVRSPRPVGPAPVLRVLQKAHTAVAMPGLAATTSRSSSPGARESEGSRWPGWPPPRPVPAPAPALDVERLTDQVVHAIGRRVSAYHERLGR
jgi:hypothetical protein